ncbi:MAG: hypothetical protein HZB31_15670 [Nitrospirae bacterium]|nr:hypothetical protein [Nitrospirota bacterium]
MVEELGLNPGVDTLARWMAHYVAEQMTIAENSTGGDKEEAEQRCFETILKLWQHRSSLPTGHRPFESFEPIFRALTRLDPENSNPYFYALSNLRPSESDNSIEDSDAIKQWLDIARGIDQAARIWLEYVFYQAALNATDEKTIKWLQNAVGPFEGDDISIIVQLVQAEPENEGKEQQDKKEELESRIKQLDAFNDFSQNLRAAFSNELKGITENNSSENAVNTDLQ